VCSLKQPSLPGIRRARFGSHRETEFLRERDVSKQKLEEVLNWKKVRIILFFPSFFLSFSLSFISIAHYFYIS
jgi:hypothetical protein